MHADLTGSSTTNLYQRPVDISVGKVGMSANYYNGVIGGSQGGPIKVFDFGARDFTIDFWQRWCGVNPTSNYAFFSYNTFDGSGGTNYGPLRIYYKYGGMFMFYFYVTNGTTAYDVYGGSPAWNTWQHVALVRSGTSIKLYIDGTQVSSQTVAADYAIQDADGCYARPYSLGGGNVAYMDQLRIFQGKALWTDNFVPPKRVDEYRRQLCRECTHWVHGNRAPIVGFMTEGSMAGGVYVYSTYNERPKQKLVMPWVPQGVDFTVEFWVKIDSRPATFGRGILGGGNSSEYGANGGYDCYLTPSGTIIFNIANEGGTGPAQSMVTATIDNGVWMHVVFSRKGTQVFSYTNGMSNGTATHSQSMSHVSITPTFLNSPSGGTWGSYSLHGSIVDFQFHTGVAKYTHGFTPSPRNLKLPGRVMRF